MTSAQHHNSQSHDFGTAPRVRRDSHSPSRPSLPRTLRPKTRSSAATPSSSPTVGRNSTTKPTPSPTPLSVSNTYYFCRFCNWGWVLDGSGHYKGGTTPPNLDNGSTDSTGVGYALSGLQYKWHNEKWSPFVRGLVGAANISPDCCHGTEWDFAAGGGGGIDLVLSRRFSFRLIQADYIYSNYSHKIQATQISVQTNRWLRSLIPPSGTASASPPESSSTSVPITRPPSHVSLLPPHLPKSGPESP